MMYIKYLEDVEALRLSISYPVGIGPRNLNTQTAKEKLKTNIARLQVPVESFLRSIQSSCNSKNTNGFFYKDAIYFASDLTYLIKLDNFHSIDEIKNELLKGFTEVHDHPKHLEYAFDQPADIQKINNYFNAPKLIENVEEKQESVGDESEIAHNTQDHPTSCCVLF